MQFVYFIVFRAGRSITFGITMCAFAVKTSVKGAQTVADESTTNEGVADKDVADKDVADKDVADKDVADKDVAGASIMLAC